MNISDTLASTPTSTLDLGRYVRVGPQTTVADTVQAMSNAGRSCACVVEGDQLAGVFTQRDVLLRVLGRPRVWDLSITEEMTRSVRTMLDTESVSDGLSIMNDWWVRSVPVLDGSDHFVGNLSYYVVMNLIADLVANRIGDIDDDAPDRLGLTLIDLTGLQMSTPVTIGLDESVAVGAHHMKVRGIGSLLVVDAREALVGVLTEFDLQTKVGCTTGDLDSVAVRDVMTPDPVALAVRSPIAVAIKEMADHGFSHVPLLGESGRPVGVASFRDLAAYIEQSFEALG